MMKQVYRLVVGFVVLVGSVTLSHAQGDLAVYDTFSRYAPAVYSINVEIPREYILTRYDEMIQQFSELHENYSDMVTSASDGISAQEMFGDMLGQTRRKLDIMKDQMLANNQLRGTGFAVDPHHIVTLSTVVKSATFGGKILVSDDFNRLIEAEVCGIDQMTGVAVLTVKNTTLKHYVDLSRISSQLPIASYIMAIQRPYDLPASPFSGMIGGYYRQIKLFQLERYIQTDLPFFPSNQGAPVFSPSGYLIGMIAADFHMGRWPGVTFVIPADFVKDSAQEIILNGKRDRGFIPGMTLGQDQSGIVIRDLVPDSPASLAGLKQGDIIVGFEGQKERQHWDLIYNIFNTKPGETVRLEIRRGSVLMEVDVKTSLYQS